MSTFLIELSSMNRLTVKATDPDGKPVEFTLHYRVHQHEKYLAYLESISQEAKQEQEERHRLMMEMEAFIEKAKQEAEAGQTPAETPFPKLPNAFELMAKRLRNKPRRAIELAMIVLNGKRDETTVTEEQIENMFELDQVELICKAWVEKKVMNPEFDRQLDPLLAPRPATNAQPER